MSVSASPKVASTTTRRYAESVICPFCGDANTTVDDTRNRGVGAVRRRRSCAACGKSFATTERVAAENMIVRKRDGRNEPFARSKIVQGINKAAWIHNKQQGSGKITPADVNAIVDRVESQLRSLEPGKPVSSIEIGTLVLRELSHGTTSMDVVCVRYAIVLYGRKTTRRSSFRGIETVIDWLRETYGRPRAAPPSTTPWRVKKRNGTVVPFEHKALAASIGYAATGHATTRETELYADRIALEVRNRLAGQGIVTTQQIAAETLQLLLRDRDALTYLRYASAAKAYSSVEDFWLELFALDPAMAAAMDESRRPDEA
jgi:transcriptional repressor NrdR